MALNLRHHVTISQMSRTPPSSDLVHFFLCQPGVFVTRVTAHSSNTCQILSPVFHDQQMIFLCNGEILSKTSSFAACGVRTDSTVLALPDGDAACDAVAKWMRTTRDADRFDDAIRSMMDSRTRPVVGRLRDLALMRADMRPNCYRRIQKGFVEEPTAWGGGPASKSAIGEVPTELPTAPLPQLW
jgi:hypothetical protein